MKQSESLGFCNNTWLSKMSRNSLLLIIFACCATLMATDARATDREDLDLSWCVPFTSRFDFQSAARNFRGSEDTRLEFESSINTALEEAKAQGLPFAFLPSSFKVKIETDGPIVTIETKKPPTPTDCENANDWTHGLVVQRETKTVTNVTLCLQTSMAQTILATTSASTGRCNPEGPGLRVTPRVTLADLMAEQDDVFNRALGADEDSIRKIAPHLSFAVVYHDTDLALLENRLPDARFSPREALKQQLNERASMVMSQFIRVGIVPGLELTVNQDGAVVNDLKDTYPKIDAAVAVPHYWAKVIGDSDLVIVARLNQPIERVRICQNCADGEQDTQFAAETSETYLTGAREDTLLSAEQIAPAQRDIVADQRLLFSDPSIQAVVHDLSDETTLTYRVTPVSRDASPRVSAGLNYSGAEGWEVPFSLQMPTPGAETKSNMSLNVTATEYGVEGSGYFNYTLQDKPAEGRGSRIDLEILASGGEDANRLFGNTTGATLTENIETLDFGLKINFGSLSYRDRQAANNIFLPTENRARRYWSSNLRTGLRYRNVDLQGTPAALVGLNTGSYFGAYLSGDVHRDSFLPFVPRSASAIPPSWTTRFDMLIGAGGTVDETFLRALVSSDLRAPFEFTNGKAGFFRVGVVGGWVSDNAPTFAYLDAADPLFLQGLRQQEYMGRSFVGVTSEVGMDITSFLGGAIPGTAKPGADTDGAESQVERRQSQEVLASVFADVGWMDDLLQNGAIISHTKRLESYGLKLAIRQIRPGGTPLEVELGYAYSPQSIFQENGVFFVGLNTTF